MVPVPDPTAAQRIPLGRRPDLASPAPDPVGARPAAKQTVARANRQAFAKLLSFCSGLRFVPHDISRQLDQRGYYDLQLEKEFPFHVTLFRVSSKHYTPIANWHERLEVVMPLDGPARVRMGEQTVALAPGDLLVVDNLKLHNLEDFPGFKTRLISISFMPEFVYGSGSPSCDYAFLIPFYAKREDHPHVLHATDSLAGPVYLALTDLLDRYFGSGVAPCAQAGCKVSFATRSMASRRCSARMERPEPLSSPFWPRAKVTTGRWKRSFKREARMPITP